MRDSRILVEVLEDMKVLYQYLYMDENNTVTVTNGLTQLELSMDDAGVIRCKNMTFPDLPPMNYTSNMTLGCIETIIIQLKQQKSEFDYFDSKWDEVLNKATSCVALTLHNMGRL